MFGIVEDVLKKGLALDPSGVAGFVFTLSKPDNKEFIIELNTDNQLFEGVNADGVLLSSIGGSYSNTTIRIKQGKGQPIDRVTLKDTGEFYESFTVNITTSGIEIQANTIKDDDDLQDRWGGELLGLTDSSVDLLVERILDDFVDWLINELFE